MDGYRTEMLHDLRFVCPPPHSLAFSLPSVSRLFPSLNGNWILHSGWPVLDLDLPLPCQPDPVLTFSKKVPPRGRCPPITTLIRSGLTFLWCSILKATTEVKWPKSSFSLFCFHP